MPDFGLGARPSLPDHRDRVLVVGGPLTKVDLRDRGPVIWDQGQLGSCVPHGSLAALNYAEQAAGRRQISGSALFVYYNGRDLEDTVDYDSGLYVRDGIKAMNRWGVADRWAWPYDISRFTERPTAHAYNNAPYARAISYARVVGVAGIAVALADGTPVVVGLSVYPSIFDVLDDGIIPDPEPGEAPVGGHCMVVVGYRPIDDRLILRNSWSANWGDHGYGYMRVNSFVRDSFADDFWVVSTAS